MSYFLAKPFRFHYLQPDILNFPTQNKNLARDFNFACELFKFLSKPVTVAFEGERLAGADDEGNHQLGGWNVTDEWYEALNQYSIPDHLKDEIYSDEWNPNHGDQNYRPENNSDVINYYENVLNRGPWGWHYDWVSGFNHFNQGLFDADMEYYWGERVAGQYSNIDFLAEGCEWNHLEEKKGLGLSSIFEDTNAPGPKDASLNADVDQAYFVGDFLKDLGMAWSEVNHVLSRFQNYSYYEMVMNAVAPGKEQHSYKSLSPEDMTLLVTAFIESRNRVFSMAEKVFGSVVYTWNDSAMISNFSSWLNAHNSPALSHGINAFRMLLHVQHLFINTISMFSETEPGGGGYQGAILDKYAFWQFAKHLGAEYYRGEDKDGDGITKGKLFEYIEQVLGINLDRNSEIRNFLRMGTDLSSLSIQTKPGDINLEEYLSEDCLDKLDDDQKKKLSAFKWLLEQWFGASKVKAGYNAMPKWEGALPDISVNDDSDYIVIDLRDFGVNFGEGESSLIKVPKTIYESGYYSVERSYSWDRISGPFHINNITAFGRARDPEHPDWNWGWINQKEDVNGSWDSSRWRVIYNVLRNSLGYNIGYLNPYTGHDGPHKNYVRHQLGSLDRFDIMGQGSRSDVYFNSWPVFIEGSLTRAGEVTNKMKMRIHSFLTDSEKRRYNRAVERYEEKKEKEKDKEVDDQKFESRLIAQRMKLKRSMQKQDASRRKRMLKLQKESDNKRTQRMLQMRKRANKAAASKKPQNSAKKS